MKALFIALVLFPIIDLALLGHWLGFWNAVLVVFGTGVVGALLLRVQGALALAKSRASLRASFFAPAEITGRLFIILAGVLLIHPGVLTDVIGVVCLLPQVRVILAAKALARVSRHGQGGFNPFGGGAQAHHQASQDSSSDIIEGEFQEMSSKKSSAIEQEKK